MFGPDKSLADEWAFKYQVTVSVVDQSCLTGGVTDEDQTIIARGRSEKKACYLTLNCHHT